MPHQLHVCNRRCCNWLSLLLTDATFCQWPWGIYKYSHLYICCISNYVSIIIQKLIIYELSSSYLTLHQSSTGCSLLTDTPPTIYWSGLLSRLEAPPCCVFLAWHPPHVCTTHSFPKISNPLWEYKQGHYHHQFFVSIRHQGLVPPAATSAPPALRPA